MAIFPVSALLVDHCHEQHLDRDEGKVLEQIEKVSRWE
jgi:hypothetical protein